MTRATKRPATYAHFEALPEHLVGEIIDGALVTRRPGRPANAMARSGLMFAMQSFRQSRKNADAEWHILHLPELHLAGSVVVPELAAWRVERLPSLPDDHLHLAPDWVCELTADDPSVNSGLEAKLALYRSLDVRYLWIVDPTKRSLRTFDGRSSVWLLSKEAMFTDEVRAPPFDAISFSLADLWPLDPPLGMNEDPTPHYAGDR